MTGVGKVAAGRRDRPPQHFRVGLLHAESVLSADRREAVGEIELFEQQHRQPFELVGADGETGAARRERSSASVNPGKGRERSAMCSHNER